MPAQPRLLAAPVGRRCFGAASCCGPQRITTCSAPKRPSFTSFNWHPTIRERGAELNGPAARLTERHQSSAGSGPVNVSSLPKMVLSLGRSVLFLGAIFRGSSSVRRPLRLVQWAFHDSDTMSGSEWTGSTFEFVLLKDRNSHPAAGCRQPAPAGGGSPEKDRPTAGAFRGTAASG